MHLLHRVRTVDQHPSADHLDGVQVTLVQERLVDRVPRHQGLRLRRQGLGLRRELGGLGLGQQRPDRGQHLVAARALARLCGRRCCPRRGRPGGRRRCRLGAPGGGRRQRAGQGWQLAQAGEQPDGAAPGRDGRHPGRDQPIDRQPVVTGGPAPDVGRPGTLGCRVQLFPPGPRRQRATARSSDLLDRHIAGQRGRPRVDPTGDVQQIAGLPTELPQAVHRADQAGAGHLVEPAELGRGQSAQLALEQTGRAVRVDLGPRPGQQPIEVGTGIAVDVSTHSLAASARAGPAPFADRLVAGGCCVP